jgi:hypothetical protein
MPDLNISASWYYLAKVEWSVAFLDVGLV